MQEYLGTMGADSYQNQMVEARVETKPDSEPIVTRERNAIPNSSGVRCNLTQVGRDVHDIEPGDPLTVEVYEDGIFISPSNDVE